MTQSEADLRAELEERLRFETLLADLSAQFVNLPADQVNHQIQEAQRRIVETLGLDRSSLFQYTEQDTKVTLTHFWVRPGLQPFPPGLSARECYPWAFEKVMMKREILRFSSADELPPEAARDLESLRKYGPRSTVTFPLIAGGQVFGALAFGTLREERQWTEALVARLRLVADVFASTLARKRSEDSLRRALDEVQRLKDQLQKEKVYLQQEVEVLHGHDGIIGNSPGLRQVLAQVDRVAPTDATVLLLGETGTGKELLAETLHARSRRKDRVMIKVNCAAMPSTLIEAELFGHEKGAYTGALSRQAGRFELADDSTLFLDEVAELPLDLQVKLLRVLQDGQFERVGGTKTLKTNVRVIAASNRDLAKHVAEGRFREDLYYRLGGFPIVVPPLRERADDIPLIAWAFAKQLGERLGKRVERIPKEVMEALQRYAWPGNVRELRNAIERAIILGDSSTLRLPPGPVNEYHIEDSRLTLAEAEQSYMRAHISKVLERTRWRIRAAGGAADVGVRTLAVLPHNHGRRVTTHRLVEGAVRSGAVELGT
jgi:transcriptional regulator with GAF, ATPase, and Fis domain